MGENGKPDPSSSQKTVGRTWADVIASIPLWLLGLAAIGFTCFLVYGTFLTNKSVKAGFLGTFGPEAGVAAAVDGAPSGAVVAFDLKDGCPDGWRDVGLRDADRFAGRTLIAAGPRVDRTDNGTTLARAFDAQGGEEQHTLTVEEMPRHEHMLFVPLSYKLGEKADYESAHDTRARAGSPTGSRFTRDHNTAIGPAGGDQNGKTAPHNNMPPYIALYFCKKEG